MTETKHTPSCPPPPDLLEALHETVAEIEHLHKMVREGRVAHYSDASAVALLHRARAAIAKAGGR